MTGGQSAMYNVNLPANYDATKPMPLGFGFHGFGNDACGPMQGECRGFAMLPAVTVYMKSISDGWEQQAVLEQNIKYFQDVLAVMKNEYCIDESRIFVAGVSSGGQFIEHLTCRFGDTLWQTTAVSASVVNAANNDCKGTPPALIIHGVTDQAGNYGQGVAEMFAKRNGCSATVPAGLAKAKTDMQAAFEAKEAKHVCLDWDACTKNAVQFCISSQITYDGLTHGWPQVGGTLIGWAIREQQERKAREAEQRRADTHRQIIAERVRIARELHDSLAHNLTLVNAQIGVASHLVVANPVAVVIAFDLAANFGGDVFFPNGQRVIVIDRRTDNVRPGEGQNRHGAAAD